jgi:hypothetical protein
LPLFQSLGLVTADTENDGIGSLELCDLVTETGGLLVSAAGIGFGESEHHDLFALEVAQFDGFAILVREGEIWGLFADLGHGAHSFG